MSRMIHGSAPQRLPQIQAATTTELDGRAHLANRRVGLTVVYSLERKSDNDSFVASERLWAKCVENCINSLSTMGTYFDTAEVPDKWTFPYLHSFFHPCLHQRHKRH
jgi:hypothetical protein